MSTQTTAQAQLTITDLTDISDVYLEYCMVEAGSTASQVESKTTWTSPERGWGITYPTWQSGYEIWIRQVKLTERPNGATYVFQTFATTTYSTGAYVRVHGYDINKEYVQQLYSYLIYPSTTLPLVQILNISSNIQFLRVSYPKTGLDNTGIFEGDTPGEGTGLIDVTTNEVGSITNGGSTTTNTSFNHTDYIPICNVSYGTPYLDTAVNQINLSIGNINTELQTRLKYFWDNLTSHTHGNNWSKPDYPAGTYMAGGIENVTFDKEDSDTYGYNTHYANGIKLRYNAINLTTLLHSGLSLYYPIVDNNNIIVNSTVGANFSASALSFFQPPTINGSNVIQGNKTLELNGNSLNFYGSDQNNADATLSSSGLKLVKGGIEAGTKNTTNYIYVWSVDDATDHTFSINNSENKSDWRIIAGQQFGVDKAGNLYASNVDINGIINATEGTIGGFSIRSGELYSLSHNEPYSNTSGIYIGTDIMAFGPNGTIWFDDSGKGKIGSWSFSFDELSLISNNTNRAIILNEQGIVIQDTSLTNNYFKVNFSEEGNLFISLLDKILIQNDQLAINANNIMLNGIDVEMALHNLQDNVNITNNEVTNIKSKLNEYDTFITINNNVFTLKRIANSTASTIEIKDNMINLIIANETITQYKSGLMHTTFGEFENLRMRTGTTGNLTWVARSNGNLSLKVVN